MASVWGSFNQLSSEVMENKLAAGVCASTVKSCNKGRDNMWTSPWGERTLPFLGHNSFVGGGAVSRRLNRFLEKRSENITFRCG